MEKSLIVAIADNLAIGKDNNLLWHISEDLKFFKRTTVGCPVIMGRKTFESIGRPLPKRLNIVISRSSEAPEGVLLVHSLEEAWREAEKWLSRADADETMAAKKAFVIGGGEIYRQAIAQVQKMYVTHVHTTINGADTFFPEIDSRVWRKEEISEPMTDPETSYDFEFVTYGRI